MGLNPCEAHLHLWPFMSVPPEAYDLPMPAAPSGVMPEGQRVLTGPDVLRKQYVTQDGYFWGQITVLSHVLDEVEREIGPDTYERMGKDPKVHKARRIRINGVLTDDLIFAPGRTEEEVGPGEFSRYEKVMNFAERIIAGLDKPYWRTLEQMHGGGLEQGNKVGEVVRDWILDTPDDTPQTTTNTKKRGAKPRGLIARMFNIKAQEPATETEPPRRGTKILQQPKIRLLPKKIKVLPRRAIYFVVDEFGNEVGLVPAWGHSRSGGAPNLNVRDILTRDKFIVFTNDPEDDDPRGRSAYRPAYTWWHFKQHIPKEYLRYLLQEALPIPVLEMPENMPRWMPKRDDYGQIEYEADGVTEKMIPAYEAGRITVENLRNGKGIAIPPKAKLTPYVGKGSAGDKIFPNAGDFADGQIEESILNQSLAQSEGEHQARSAAQVVEGRLNDVFFWDKRALCVMTLYDLVAVDIRWNLGDWALRYMPKLSLGDSEKRNWAEDLKTISEAYFRGFIDDTQRPELMAWLSLPKPGPSRAQVLAEQDPETGEARMPNSNRPDKKPENAGRNDGNSKDKSADAVERLSDQAQRDAFYRAWIDNLAEKVRNAEISQSGVFALGNHGKRKGSFVEYLPGKAFQNGPISPGGR